MAPAWRRFSRRKLTLQCNPGQIRADYSNDCSDCARPGQPVREKHMAIATLVSWLLTAGIGAYMLRTWFVRGGGRRAERGAGAGLPPVVVYGHASMAVTGLVLWISYVVAGLPALAWAAAGLLMPVVGVGVAMVTLWTPYPVPAVAGAGRPAGGMLATPAEDAMAGGLTDEVLARALTDDALASWLADEV